LDCSELEAVFFRKRWPNGFECPRCGHGACYTIRTRRLPLYQCRLCKHQTTVTAGTVMDRSRTPLAKWDAAMDLLASSSGINAAQLAAGIDVSHKTAWIMLRSFRRAIRLLEAERKLGGTVHAGLRVLGPYLFITHRHYRKERVVLVTASLDETGEPTAMTMTAVNPEHLESGKKELTRGGAASLLKDTDALLLNHVRMCSSPLRPRFEEAAKWLNRLFHGLGSTYLQSYLDEYCFRWNAAAQGLSLQDHWYKICFRAF
jgi:transposase-like protein